MENHAELVIDNVTGFIRDRQYNRIYQLDRFNIPCRKASPAERLEPFERFRRGLLKFVSRNRPFERKLYIEQEGNDFDARLLNMKVHGKIYLDGLWQSENYFKEIETTIRQDLQIKAPRDPANQEMRAKISKHTSVAVHVRFFEEPTAAASTHNAPSDYYSRAINEMERRVPNLHYFVFSDQPAAARIRIPLSDNRVTMVTNNRGDENAYADLWLMSQCQHFIIANSTFSWWGAWLGKNADKLVIAPGFERKGGVTSWGFDGLLPKEWLQIC